jgi:hypothetical protein
VTLDEAGPGFLRANPDYQGEDIIEPLTAEEQIALIRRSLDGGLTLDRFVGSVPVFRPAPSASGDLRARIMALDTRLEYESSWNDEQAMYECVSRDAVLAILELSAEGAESR